MKSTSMTWASLKLWSRDEEKKIHVCIIGALVELINSKVVNLEDEEIVVSGKLRPILYKVKKEKGLAWTLHPEASSFEGATEPKPYGHPDFRLSGNTADYDQYDYDIECKLVRVRRKWKRWDYCEHYVVDGPPASTRFELAGEFFSVIFTWSQARDKAGQDLIN